MVNKPIDILKKYFQFNSFKGEQEKIINRLLSSGDHKNHCLVLMPTGGGKSLCYQVPALCSEGGTLVISPLIALMQDQVEALQKKSIKAAYINSTVSRHAREKRLEQFIQGKIKMLYVTPERFRKKEFYEAIKSANISLLAVDEAHCISEWGHDFRPDYSRVGEFRHLIGNPLTIALTATATAKVQQDIIEKLHLDPESVQVFHQGIERPNLRLEVQDVISEDERLDKICEVLAAHPGSGIIYFALIKSLEYYSELLKRKGISHGVYHGKLPAGERERIQRWFIEGDSRLVLATNAFGMGIDKADIRFVIHAQIPGSMESYYQEIGRAGRDGKDALCLMLFDQNDLAIQMDFIQWSNPQPHFYTRLYSLLYNNESKINSLGADYLREQLNFKNRNDFRLETAFNMMDRYGVTEGSIEGGTLKLVDELPDVLHDEDVFKQKLLNDQKKLHSVVQYFRTNSCRRVFISEYFGFFDQVSCKNCDRCSEILEETAG